MQSIFDYGKKLNQLCKNKQYHQVIAIYQNEIESRFSEYAQSSSFLIINSISEAYCYTNHWEKGLKFGLKHLDKLAKMSATNTLKNLGWLLFKALQNDPPHIKADQLDQEQVEHLLQILKTTAGCNEIAIKLFQCWLRSLLKVPNLPVEVGERFFHLYNPDELREQSLTGFAGGNNEGKSLAVSELEQWYLSYSKFLYNHQQWVRCSQVCQQALDTDVNFTSGGKIWLTRRLALSLKQTGDIGHATVLMELLVKQKPDWYIQHELAALYLLQNDTDKALEYASLALHNGGYSEYKVNLLEFIGQLYDKRNDRDTAINFYYTAAFVRRSKGWPLSKELEARVWGNKGVSDNPRILYSILQQILPVKGVTDKLLHGTGKITRILHDVSNGDGFITDQQGNTIYFRFAQAKLKPEELKVGTPVKFKAHRKMHNGKWKWVAIKVYLQTLEK